MDSSSRRTPRGRPAYRPPSRSGPRQRLESEQRTFGKQKALTEYLRMLAYQTLDQLRTIAQQRGIALQAASKEAIVAELAAQLSDPQATCAVLDGLPEPERQTLVQLHLALAPEYGLGVESVLRELVRQDPDSSRRTLYKQCVALSQKGLLLPFKQNDALYYALPNVVRANLPVQAGLVPAYPEDRLDELAVRETEIGPVIQTLFAIWTYVSDRAVADERLGIVSRTEYVPTNAETPAEHLPQARQPREPMLHKQALPRRPIEDQWPHLQEWAHIPAEVHELERQHQYRRRSSTPGRGGAETSYAGGLHSPQSPGTADTLPPIDHRARAVRVRSNRPAYPGSRSSPSPAGPPSAGPTDTGYIDASNGAGRHQTLPLGQSMTVPPAPYRLHSRDRRFIQEQIGCSDEEFDFYYALLEEIGALGGQAGEPVTADERAIQRFLRMSPASKIRTLWEAWEETTSWSEMDVVLRAGPDAAESPDLLSTLARKSAEPGEQPPAPAPDVSGPPESLPGQGIRLRRNPVYVSYKPDDLYQEWRAGRQVIARLLSLLPPGRWLSVHELERALFEINPNLLHTRSHPSAWWLESPRTGKQFGTTFDDWRASYGQFVLAMLQGPLHWLGMVKLAYRGGQSMSAPRLEAFQLGPAGAFALGRSDSLVENSGRLASAASPDQPVCTIEDDMTVTLIPGYAPLELYDLLHTIARLVKATPERFVYRLTAEGVFRWVLDYRTSCVRDHSGSTPAQTDQDTASRPAEVDRPAGIEALISLLAGYAAGPLAPAGRSVSAGRSESILPGSSQPKPRPTAPWATKLRTWIQNYGQLHLYEDLTLVELADDYVLQELLVSTSLHENLIYTFSPRLVAIHSHAVESLVQEMEKRGYTPRVEYQDD
jgi:hypothetical protein